MTYTPNPTISAPKQPVQRETLVMGWDIPTLQDRENLVQTSMHTEPDHEKRIPGDLKAKATGLLWRATGFLMEIRGPRDKGGMH